MAIYAMAGWRFEWREGEWWVIYPSGHLFGCYRMLSDGISAMGRFTLGNPLYEEGVYEEGEKLDDLLKLKRYRNGNAT